MFSGVIESDRGMKWVNVITVKNLSPQEAKNPCEFHATGLFLYPLKTFYTLWFCDDFRGNRRLLIRSNALNIRNEIGGKKLEMKKLLVTGVR